ncbi:MAG: SDR family NAD(P)-dependent oxidoreductase [Clostridia bacterium]|nr:SDR family NAD(P)-dependent oxidoreductase [Clostridia bacterium]
MPHPSAILITGASGSLGLAAVNAFAGAGWLVYAADVSPGEYPAGVRAIEMDVTDERSVASAARLIEEEAGGLDAILHMAGLYTMDSFIEIEPDTLRRMLDVNLFGVYLVNREFLPLIREKRGRIIITASELAPLDPLPFNGIYSMTKRALDGYAHSLALELDLIGVRVVTLYPGAYGDGMTRAAVRAMERMSERTRLYPGIADRFRRIVAAETGSAKPPEKLAARILRIAGKRRPRLRYFMNDSLKLRLFSLLPMRAQAFALRLLLKGKERPSA